MIAGIGYFSLAATICLVGAAHALSPVDPDDIDVNGLSYSVQNAGRPWSLQSPEPGVLRFELRPGDVWRGDTPIKERTEIAGATKYAPGDTIKLRYVFRVEPGPENTSEWLHIGQFHDVDELSPAQFAVELIGEHLAIHLRAKMPDGSNKDWFAFIDDEPIIRGNHYTLEAELNMPDGPTGSVDVWLDGEHIVDYTGMIGYGSSVYWKQGIYRASSPETLIVEYRESTIEG